MPLLSSDRFKAKSSSPSKSPAKKDYTKNVVWLLRLVMMVPDVTTVVVASLRFANKEKKTPQIALDDLETPSNVQDWGPSIDTTRGEGQYQTKFDETHGLGYILSENHGWTIVNSAFDTVNGLVEYTNFYSFLRVFKGEITMEKLHSIGKSLVKIGHQQQAKHAEYRAAGMGSSNNMWSGAPEITYSYLLE